MNDRRSSGFLNVAVRLGQRWRQLGATLALFAVAPPAFAQQDATRPADASLKALYQAEWAWRTAELGLERAPDSPGPDRFPSVDAASQQRRLTYWQRTLAELDRIPLARLSAEERINAAVFRTVLQSSVASIRYKDYEAPVTSGGSFWTWMAPRQGFRTAAHYRAYLARLRDLPRYLDQQTSNLRAGSPAASPRRG